MNLSAISLKGLRLGVPRGYFGENLDAEVETVLAATLAQLAAAGVVLVEGDMDNVAALDAAAGFPVALYEFVTDFNRYLAGHATGLDFAGVAAQVKSPAVKKVVDGLLGADAVPEPVYREALNEHRPALRDAYHRASPRWCFRPPRWRRPRSAKTKRSFSTADRRPRFRPTFAISGRAAPPDFPA
jgi:mandelamide amidase